MVSPYDIQRHNQQGIADAIAGLGEIFLGNPQLDAQLAQGQAQMALRDKRLTEAEIAREEANRGAMDQDRASRVFHQVAAIDPNSPQFADDMARNVAMLMGTGVYDDPAKYGTAARLFTNIRGGDINQIARGETDLSKLVELEELGDTRAQREALGNVIASLGQQGGQGGSPLGADAVQAVLQSDLPDFQKRMVADIFYNETDPSRASSVAMGNVESFVDPSSGRLLEHNVSSPSGRARVVYNPAWQYREGGGAAPPPVPSDPNQVSVPTPGGAGEAFGAPGTAGASGQTPEPGVQQPPGGAEQNLALEGQQAPPPEGQQAPPTPGLGGQPNMSPLPGPERQELDRRLTQNSQVTEDGQVQIKNSVGSIKVPLADEGGWISAFDALEYTGPGGALQRGITDYAGGFSDRFSFGKSKAARTSLGLLNAELRSLLSVSDRPSKMELEWIQSQLAKGDFFESPAASDDVLTQLNGWLKREQQLIHRQLGQDLPNSTRKKLLDQLVYTQGLLYKVGQPREISSSEVFGERMGEIGRAFSGTREEVDRVRQDASRAFGAPAESGTPDYSNMSDEELRRRLQGGG